MFTVEKAVGTDADFLAGRLRKADVEEVYASCGVGPFQALHESLYLSDKDMSWCLHLGVEPVALFGAAPLFEDVGSVWLLGSPRIREHPLDFVKKTHEYVAKMHTRYRVLTNFVDARNMTSRRWLESCGFQAVQTIEEYGHAGLPFIQYAHIEVDHV